jgi:hypothetical protein
MLHSLILQKAAGTEPRRPSAAQIAQIYTPVDGSPYPFFFQGTMSENPRVFSRRAGWAPQSEYILGPQKKMRTENPQHCFEAACNTVYTKVKEGDKCVIQRTISTYR